MFHLCLSISRPLLCVRVCVTGGRRCAPPVPTRQPSSLQGPALWSVCGMWPSTRTNSLAWNSDRLVCSWNVQREHPGCTNALGRTLTLFFFLAVIRSHRLRDVSGCVRDPQHDSKWLPWPHLYPVGYRGAKLHHPVSRAHDERLCTGYQWPHCKSTFFFLFFYLLSSGNLLFFWSWTFFGSVLSCCSSSFSHQQKKERLLIVDTVQFLFVCVSAFPQIGVNTLFFCPRVRLHHVQDLCSTCGLWRVSCWPALTCPAGLRQTSCVSASHSGTSGMPRT